MILAILKKTKVNHAFTFLEVIVALTVFSMSFLLISLALKTIEGMNFENHVDKQIEWHLFLNQWETYLKDEELVSVTRNYVITDMDGAKVYYELPSNNRRVFIRRKSGGNQRLLSGLKQLTFSSFEDRHVINAHFLNGQSFQAFIPSQTISGYALVMPIETIESDLEKDDLTEDDKNKIDSADEKSKEIDKEREGDNWIEKEADAKQLLENGEHVLEMTEQAP